MKIIVKILATLIALYIISVLALAVVPTLCS